MFRAQWRLWGVLLRWERIPSLQAFPSVKTHGWLGWDLPEHYLVKFWFLKRGREMSLCELGCLLQSSRTLSRDIHQWQLCALLKTAYISSFPITDKFLCPCLMTLEPDIKCLEQWFSTLAASHLELLRIPISRPHPWPVKSASLWGRPGHQGCESSPGDSNMQPRLRIADLKGQSPRESKQKKTSFYTPKKGRKEG